jgi:hypothetical protein
MDCAPGPYYPTAEIKVVVPTAMSCDLRHLCASLQAWHVEVGCLTMSLMETPRTSTKSNHARSTAEESCEEAKVLSLRNHRQSTFWSRSEPLAPAHRKQPEAWGDAPDKPWCLITMRPCTTLRLQH